MCVHDHRLDRCQYLDEADGDWRLMELLLAVHSYPGANHRIEAHYPFYEKSGASNIIGVITNDGKCKWPNCMTIQVGANSYIDGDVLPRRLIDTMKLMLLLPYERFCIIEWDCLFFHPLPEFDGMAAFHAGNRMGDMKPLRFYHVPWCFDFESGTKFVEIGQRLINEKRVTGHECSPDVFFGWVCEEAGLPVMQPWKGFSRNSLDCAGDLELAREAYRDGAVAIHGIKGAKELEFILS